MAREIAITLYLFVFRCIFYICKLFPQKKKTTFVASFGENVLFTMKALERQIDDHPIVLITTPQCKIDFQHRPNRTLLRFDRSHILEWFRSIYHLATSETIFIDNYYGFLAATPFHPGVRCIQLWHATGAIKQFGLLDPTNRQRTSRANQRFQVVYNRFDHIVVGSEKMAAVFAESFGLPEDRMLYTGVPRTDLFFDEVEKASITSYLRQELPMIKDKQVILYAPTFRDGALHDTKLSLDIDKMYREFGDAYILLLRLHPAINGTYQNKHPGFVVNVSGYHSVNHLLLITDLLITDYSSIPFEFALLNRPTIYFAHDLEQYAENRGFWEDYDVLVPGPIVTSMNELIQAIHLQHFDNQALANFRTVWNRYADGQASDRLIEAIYEVETTERVAQRV